MAIVSHVYTDPTLTTPFDDASPLSIAALQGSSGDGVVYVGLTDAAQQLQAESDPGIDPITVTITDATVGAGVEAAHIKLASTAAGLDTATGGVALSLGATISGGAANRREVHIRWANSTGGAASTEISLALPAVVTSLI